jgi:hypothetical protein
MQFRTRQPRLGAPFDDRSKRWTRARLCELQQSGLRVLRILRKRTLPSGAGARRWLLVGGAIFLKTDNEAFERSRKPDDVRVSGPDL